MRGICGFGIYACGFGWGSGWRAPVFTTASYEAITCGFPVLKSTVKWLKWSISTSHKMLPEILPSLIIFSPYTHTNSHTHTHVRAHTHRNSHNVLLLFPKPLFSLPFYLCLVTHSLSLLQQLHLSIQDKCLNICPAKSQGCNYQAAPTKTALTNRQPRKAYSNDNYYLLSTYLPCARHWGNNSHAFRFLNISFSPYLCHHLGKCYCPYYRDETLRQRGVGNSQKLTALVNGGVRETWTASPLPTQCWKYIWCCLSCFPQG